MKAYQRVLKEKGTTQGMSRKATCLDHAVAEHFFGLLKTELFYLETFDSIDQLEKAIVAYIGYYHNHRIKLKLNGLSPVQYRIQTVQAAYSCFCLTFGGHFRAGAALLLFYFFRASHYTSLRDTLRETLFFRFPVVLV